MTAFMNATTQTCKDFLHHLHKSGNHEEKKKRLEMLLFVNGYEICLVTEISH
jgi:hypothetical protein